MKQQTRPRAGARRGHEPKETRDATRRGPRKSKAKQLGLIVVAVDGSVLFDETVKLPRRKAEKRVVSLAGRAGAIIAAHVDTLVKAAVSAAASRFGPIRLIPAGSRRERATTLSVGHGLAI